MDVTTDLTTEKIARAFSSHRVEVALPHLADDVVWTLVGSDPLIGRKAVKKACERTAKDLAGVTTEFQRFRTVVGEDSVVVDSLARYTDAGGAGNTEYVQYILTSQTWQDIPWRHQLYVLRPQSMARDGTVRSSRAAQSRQGPSRATTAVRGGAPRPGTRTRYP